MLGSSGFKTQHLHSQQKIDALFPSLSTSFSHWYNTQRILFPFMFYAFVIEVPTMSGQTNKKACAKAWLKHFDDFELGKCNITRTR
jgi:hypothetical protein